MAHFHGRSVREPRLSPSPVCSRWNSVSCSSSIALLPSSLPEFHIRLWLSPARRQVWVSLCIESIPPSPSSNSLWEEGRKEAYFLPHSPSCLPSVITMTVAEKEAGGRKQYETEINPARTSVSLSCLSASVSVLTFISCCWWMHFFTHLHSALFPLLIALESLSYCSILKKWDEQ